ncbi:MAG: RagB/SusD family nutrient uptake outer membrane protein [Gemmatimonadetes bacterium]|nr:RagB/SusD family nutrient uptake outer membrane protein [Gemmatimonadota bacterium]
MNAYKAIPVLLAIVAMSACETLVVPDLNNPSIEELTGEGASRVAVVTAAQGLFVRARQGIAGRAGYVSEVGIIGRESYNFDAADPRFVTELLRDPLDGGNGAFGGNHWAGRYRGFRDADNVLNAVDALATMDAGDKGGLRGIAKTLQALDLLLVINTRDDLGAVITVAADPTGDPEPIVDRAAVFARITALLDEAQGDLTGASFPSDLRLPSGFDGFDTPAGFLTFNRALKARVDVYLGNDLAALTSLGASFIDPTGDMRLGVYYNYGVGSGDQVNNLFDPSELIILAHPSIETDAQLQTDAVTLDQRFVDKIVSVASVGDQGGLGLSSDLAFNLYTSATTGIPIIRNEELILLRAEANLRLGNFGLASDDLNILRGAAGLVDIDLSTMNATQRIDELLYNRRYSLLFEGHRWIDMRRYDRLSDLLLDPSLRVHARFPFPVSECDARVPPPSQGCA